MKQIVIALIITVMAYCNAEAQANCNPKHVTKHKSSVTQNTQTLQILLPVQETATNTEICRQVPFEVCSISADRRHVNCYKTTDLTTLAPLNNYETNTYGPTGEMPGEPMKFDIETTVINAKPLPKYCTHDNTNRQTVCFTDEVRLVRDENGFYSYR